MHYNNVLRFYQGLLNSKIFPNLYLEGSCGSGKEYLLLGYLKAQVCLNQNQIWGGCSKCLECQQIHRFTHPSLYFLTSSIELKRWEFLNTVLIKFKNTLNDFEMEWLNCEILILVNKMRKYFQLLRIDKANSELAIILKKLDVLYYQLLGSNKIDFFDHKEWNEILDYLREKLSGVLSFSVSFLRTIMKQNISGSKKNFILIHDAAYLKELEINTILKFVEEGMHNSQVFFLTHQEDVLLPTLRSRTIKILHHGYSDEFFKQQSSLFHHINFHQWVLLNRFEASFKLDVIQQLSKEELMKTIKVLIVYLDGFVYEEKKTIEYLEEIFDGLENYNQDVKSAQFLFLSVLEKLSSHLRISKLIRS